MAQMWRKKYAALIFALESKSEEKSPLFLIEKKIAIFVNRDISKIGKKNKK